MMIKKLMVMVLAGILNTGAFATGDENRQHVLVVTNKEVLTLARMALFENLAAVG